MLSDYRCFFCFVRAFEKLLEEEKLTVSEKNSFVRGMALQYSTTYQNFSAPLFSRDLHQVLKIYSRNPDPFVVVKKQSNDLVLGMYPALKKLLQESENPYETALRLAIAGNIIDFAVGDTYDLQATIHNVLYSEFAINHSSELRTALLNAKSVLYLGDNAGEIVFDKLFIETIMHPNLTYVVRGAPVINDATMDDAHYVGMDTVADVISSGYDAPSTIVDKCSDEFQKHFNEADVIISKGQGNLEGLLGKTDKEVYFLLMVKCDVIAEALNVKKGGFVVKKQD
ncbi:MAG TPA: ARMT1-like domain-containing protein [Prolixibacteraceae bacterium]|nr:ARMT1-like domain-containing protein [Prolixibacteraceae bacterium]